MFSIRCPCYSLFHCVLSLSGSCSRGRNPMVAQRPVEILDWMASHVRTISWIIGSWLVTACGSPCLVLYQMLGSAQNIHIMEFEGAQMSIQTVLVCVDRAVFVGSALFNQSCSSLMGVAMCAVDFMIETWHVCAPELEPAMS